METSPETKHLAKESLEEAEHEEPGILTLLYGHLVLFYSHSSQSFGGAACRKDPNPQPWLGVAPILFFNSFLKIYYLFIWLCQVSVVVQQDLGSSLWHAGSSSLTRNQTWPPPAPCSLGPWSLSHWTSREVPHLYASIRTLYFLSWQ